MIHYSIEKTKSSFLSLPQSVRFKVYEYAHLIRSCPINLATEGQRTTKADKIRKKPYTCRYHERRRHASETPNPEFIDCLCFPLPHQLLHISKAIHDEVEALLYGLNTFSVSPFPMKSPDHLRVLHSLSANAWRSMKSLHISLTARERILGLWSLDGKPETFPSIEDIKSLSSEYTFPSGGGVDYPATDAIQPHYYLLNEVQPQTLRDNSNLSQEIFNEWIALCDVIETQTSASQLSLSINCTTDDANMLTE